MSPAIRQAALRCLDLGPAEADAIEAACPIQSPSQGHHRIATYEELLGPPVVRRAAPAPAYAGSIEHAFILSLWPHLFWTVRESATGETFSVGFENQFAPASQTLEPACFRPEFVTLGLLQRVAEKWALQDGWEMDLVVRFEFPSGTFEGRFLWGLLQEWNRLPVGESLR